MNIHNWRRITKALTEAETQPTALPQTREALAEAYGQVWCSLTLARDFEVEAFHEGKVIAIRRCDGQRGTLCYQHTPRFYWGFVPA